MYKYKFMILLTAFALAGCSATFPVRGLLKNPTDRFHGEINISSGKRATFTFTSLSRKKCYGVASFSDSGNGTAEFQCVDSRSGELMMGNLILSAGSSNGHGYGYGKLTDGQKITLQIGEWLSGI